MTRNVARPQMTSGNVQLIPVNSLQLPLHDHFPLYDKERFWLWFGQQVSKLFLHKCLVRGRIYGNLAISSAPQILLKHLAMHCWFAHEGCPSQSLGFINNLH
jgi:hypothetical protein